MVFLRKDEIIERTDVGLEAALSAANSSWSPKVSEFRVSAQRRSLGSLETEFLHTAFGGLISTTTSRVWFLAEV